jgi:hypothetical protein
VLAPSGMAWRGISAGGSGGRWSPQQCHTRMTKVVRYFYLVMVNAPCDDESNGPMAARTSLLFAQGIVEQLPWGKRLPLTI